MARTLVTASDFIVGSGHPTLPQVKDIYVSELWTSFILEHSSTTGEHLAPFDTLGILEVGTYTGTGATLPITLTGSLANRTVKAVLVWSAETGAAYLKTATMTNTKPTTDVTATFAQGITAIGTATFTLGTNVNVNDSGKSYFFIALGAGTTPDTGSTASPPSWIGHNVAMLGGNAATMANSVENALDTQFKIEHSEAGVHTSAAFLGITRIALGTFTPDGTSSQTVNLEDVTIDIQFLLIWAEDIRSPVFKTEAMTTLRQFTNTAISSLTSPALTLATGSFSIDCLQRYAQETFIDLQDQANGSTSFPDGSGFSNDFNVYSSASWTNSTFAEGSTSMVFSSGGNLSLAGQEIDIAGDFEISFYIKGTSTDNLGRFFEITGGEAYTESEVKIGHTIGTSSGASTVTVTVIIPGESEQTIVGTTDVKDNAWHQVEVIKANDIITLKVGGSAEGTPVTSAVTFISDPYMTSCRIGLLNYTTGSTFYCDRLILKRTPYIFGNQTYYYLGM